MNDKPVFVAALYSEAMFWVRAWGYRPEDVRIILSPIQAYGVTTDRAFVCGSQPLIRAVCEVLERYGDVEYIDAHDMDTDREPQSALWNLPLS